MLKNLCLREYKIRTCPPSGQLGIQAWLDPYIAYKIYSRVSRIKTALRAKVEDLKVLRRSPDLLNNFKIGQG